MSDAELRDFEPGRDDAAAEDLWSRCFGRARGGQTLAWLFREGPAGAAPRCVAVVDGRIVAHAGVAPLRFRIAGREARAGYSVGAMTDPAFRGRGLFVRTAEHLYARLAREDFAFVAGFSNAQSARIHTETLGRRALRPFPWSVRPLRPLAAGVALAAHALGRTGPEPPSPAPDEVSAPPDAAGVRVVPCAPDDARVDAVWERARSDVTVGAIRDAAYARWRYGSRPDAGYRACLALRGDAPVGWAVLRGLPIRGLRALFLLEALADPADEGAGTALLAAVEACARGGRVHLLSALRPGRGRVDRLLRRAGYRSIPEPLHPQTIRLSVRGFGPFADSEPLGSPEAWWLSWGDTDVV